MNHPLGTLGSPDGYQAKFEARKHIFQAAFEYETRARSVAIHTDKVQR